MGGPYAALDFARPFVPGQNMSAKCSITVPVRRGGSRRGARLRRFPSCARAGQQRIGCANECPGGFGELMLLDETMLLEVPDGTSDGACCVHRTAGGRAGTAARRGRPEKCDVILVPRLRSYRGWVIAGLSHAGAGPIIAADFHARRALALAMGAHTAIDPRETDPFARCPKPAIAPPT
ncbi:MAG: hypothetical protein R3D89_07870 [Sphingomonadaceae bacterium]